MTTARYTTKPLDPTTWDAFAALVEANGGIFGGCWWDAAYALAVSRVAEAAGLRGIG